MKRRHKIACIAVIILLLMSLLLSRSQIGCAVDIAIHAGHAPFMGKIQGEYICRMYSGNNTIPFEITSDKVLKIEKQKCWRNPIKVIFLWTVSLFSFHGPDLEADTVIKLMVPKELLLDAKSSGAYLLETEEGFLQKKVQPIKFYYRYKDYTFFKITKYYGMKGKDGKYSEEEVVYDLEITMPSSRSNRQKIDLYFHSYSEGVPQEENNQEH